MPQPGKIKQKYTFSTPGQRPSGVQNKAARNGQAAGEARRLPNPVIQLSAPRRHVTAPPATPAAPTAPSPGRGASRTAQALLARRKVVRLLIAVIVSFATCVLPYHVRVLWQTWGNPHLSFWTALLPPITFLIFYLNSGLNPILYAFLSDNFRRSLREALLCGRQRRRRGLSTASSASLRTGSTGAGVLGQH